MQLDLHPRAELESALGVPPFRHWAEETKMLR
jgi:hypothetical protein